MIEHKIYECEFCGREFEAEEREIALQHEAGCSCNPKHRRCGSCDRGRKVSSYGEDYIRCEKLKGLDDCCGDWKRDK